MNIKTIDINAKQWFDKVNGNSYFSVVITLNLGMKAKYSIPKDMHTSITQLSETIINIPYQYGYGDHYIDVSNQLLIKEGYINGKRNNNGSYTPLWQYVKDNNIILRTSKKENCLKRELIS